MSTITLTRFWCDDYSTLGVLKAEGLDGPLCTLELPWRDNALRVSCIPPGTYGWSKWSGSKTFDYETIRLHDDQVMPRSAILIHRANWHSQLLGCVAPGLTFKDWDANGWGVASSEKALNRLMGALPDSGTITIVDAA